MGQPERHAARRLTFLPARAALGALHGKVAVLAPPLAKLGITFSQRYIDTDRFGAFTAETPRSVKMADAARAKARATTKAAITMVASAAKPCCA
jgi:hypothetical protein